MRQEKVNGKLFKVSLNIKKCTNVSGRVLHQYKKVHLRGPPRGGCMFPCSLWKFTVVPLFLKNKLRCSPKFTFTEFPVPRNSAPCSLDHQKYSSLFPTIPLIFYFFMVSYFHRFYLVSHSTDTPFFFLYFNAVYLFFILIKSTTQRTLH